MENSVSPERTLWLPGMLAIVLAAEFWTGLTTALLMGALTGDLPEPFTVELLVEELLAAEETTCVLLSGTLRLLCGAELSTIIGVLTRWRSPCSRMGAW